MRKIHLPRGEWSYDEAAALGTPGGFGKVLRGRGSDGQPVAVKLIHLEVGAAGVRELEIADALIGKDLKHVVPAYDAGLDADSERFFLVMAMAERSLREELSKLGQLAEADAMAVLEQIALGL